MTNEIPVCEHCGSQLKKMEIPPEANFNAPFFWVCFNDECTYFNEGWEWMKSRYNVTASYRYRIDPSNGEAGPLPIWSKDALKEKIID